MRPLARLAAAVLALASSGCLLEPDDREERLGIIQILPGFPAAVGAPQSAGVNEPFVVSVVTHGGGCLLAGPTRVRKEGTTVDVRPYDLHLGDSECTAHVAFHHHVATLEFDQPGPVTVRFIGMGHPGGNIVTITRTVTIQQAD